MYLGRSSGWPLIRWIRFNDQITSTGDCNVLRRQIWKFEKGNGDLRGSSGYSIEVRDPHPKFGVYIIYVYTPTIIRPRVILLQYPQSETRDGGSSRTHRRAYPPRPYPSHQSRQTAPSSPVTSAPNFSFIIRRQPQRCSRFVWVGEIATSPPSNAFDELVHVLESEDVAARDVDGGDEWGYSSRSLSR